MDPFSTLRHLIKSLTPPDTDPVGDPGLYVGRELVNQDQLQDWWQQARQPHHPESIDAHPHVTVAQSRVTPRGTVPPDIGPTTVQPHEIHGIDVLGNDTEKAVVLRFSSPYLEQRWKDYGDAGAMWDFNGYKPHLTLFYLPADSFGPGWPAGGPPMPDFPLHFGPEQAGPRAGDVFAKSIVFQHDQSEPIWHPEEAERGQVTAHRYSFHHADHPDREYSLYLHTFEKTPDVAEVVSVHPTYRSGDYGEMSRQFANTVGVSGMREVVRRLRELHPNVKSFTGDRVTGVRARSGAQQSTKVTLAKSMDGEELTVYHGSPKKNLHVIQSLPTKHQFDNPTSQFGAFFTPDIHDASRYAGKNGRVYEVKMPVKNPYRMGWGEFGKFQDITRDRDRRPLESKHWDDRMEELKREALDRRAELIAAGHDGIVVHSAKGHIREIASFTDVPIEDAVKPKTQAKKPADVLAKAIDAFAIAAGLVDG